jgi:hypothetical protein
LAHAHRMRIDRTRKHRGENVFGPQPASRTPPPRGISLPSGSRPVYGLARFGAPPSRAVKPSGVVARPRSLTVAGAAQDLNASYQLSVSPVSRLSRAEDVSPGTWNLAAASTSHAATRRFYSSRVVQIPPYGAAGAGRGCCGAISGQAQQNQGGGLLTTQSFDSKPHSKKGVRC